MLRMFLSLTAARQSLQKTACLSVDVFFGGQHDGLQRSLALLFTCSLSSLFISFALLLYLHFGLQYNLAVAGSIAAGIGTLLTAAFFKSNRMRCLGTLFLISFFMKKSRNLLLTAGTSVVVLRNIQNTLENLKGLLESIICNVSAKKEALIDPFRKYVEILEWIKSTLTLKDLGIARMYSNLTVEPRLESGPLKEMLAEAEQTLNGTVKHALTIVSTISSVTKKLFPAISLVVLAVLITLHVNRFRKDLKYKNRFIGRKFVEFDEKQKAAGKPHVLPLTPEEEQLYTALLSVRPTSKEGRAMLKFGAPVATHLVAWSIIIIVDALLYYFVNVVATKFSELEPLHVPLLMITKVIANVGITFEAGKSQSDFSYSVTLFEKKCLPRPKLLLYNSIIPLAAILLTLFVMALMASKVAQIRLLVCERFFSTVAEARVEHLHAKILRKRSQARMRGLPSPFFKPHFWFPLLFRLKEAPQSAV